MRIPVILKGRYYVSHLKEDLKQFGPDQIIWLRDEPNVEGGIGLPGKLPVEYFFLDDPNLIGEPDNGIIKAHLRKASLGEVLKIYEADCNAETKKRAKHHEDILEKEKQNLRILAASSESAKNADYKNIMNSASLIDRNLTKTKYILDEEAILPNSQTEEYLICYMAVFKENRMIKVTLTKHPADLTAKILKQYRQDIGKISVSFYYTQENDDTPLVKSQIALQEHIPVAANSFRYDNPYFVTSIQINKYLREAYGFSLKQIRSFLDTNLLQLTVYEQENYLVFIKPEIDSLIRKSKSL